MVRDPSHLLSTAMRRLLRWTSGTLLTCLGVLSALAFHDRYWRWRDCFNDLGRCYDPVSQEVFLEQAGAIWGSLAVAFLAAGLVILLWPGRRR